MKRTTMEELIVSTFGTIEDTVLDVLAPQKFEDHQRDEQRVSDVYSDRDPLRHDLSHLVYWSAEWPDE